MIHHKPGGSFSKSRLAEANPYVKVTRPRKTYGFYRQVKRIYRLVRIPAKRLIRVICTIMWMYRAFRIVLLVRKWLPAMIQFWPW